MKLTRRESLKLLGSLATAAAVATTAGCCRHRYPESLIGQDEIVGGTLDLRPARVVKSSLAPARCIDVHAHFFNASDVPVKDFVAKCLGHSLDEPLRSLAKLLAPLANALAELAPTAKEDLADIRAMERQVAGLAPAQARSFVDARVQSRLEARSRDVASILGNTDFERRYIEIKAQVAGPQSAGAIPGLTADTIRNIATRNSVPRARAAIEAAIAPARAAARGMDADGIVRFITFMVSSRLDNLERYKKAYTEAEHAFGIDTVLGALVDFDYWLDCPPLSSHEDQIALHAALARKYAGYLLPVVAYNPMTDIKQKGAGLARAMDAVDRLGFVGVKIYPPMGFAPADNKDKKLNETLKKFFDACTRRQLPVMAHAAQSLGLDASHDLLGAPTGWAALLKQYDTHTGDLSAVVNVSHFGGAASKQENDWTQEFADLMATSYGRRLYGDIGFWDELYRCEKPAVCEAARQRLAKTVAAHSAVQDRVMFGTDWLMLSRIEAWPEYPQQVALALDGVLSMDKLFGANAAACFRI